MPENFISYALFIKEYLEGDPERLKKIMDAIIGNVVHDPNAQKIVEENIKATVEATPIIGSASYNQGSTLAQDVLQNYGTTSGSRTAAIKDAYTRYIVMVSESVQDPSIDLEQFKEGFFEGLKAQGEAVGLLIGGKLQQMEMGQFRTFLTKEEGVHLGAGSENVVQRLYEDPDIQQKFRK